jgi:hypothetical protein
MVSPYPETRGKPTLGHKTALRQKPVENPGHNVANARPKGQDQQASAHEHTKPEGKLNLKATRNACDRAVPYKNPKGKAISIALK